MAFEKFTDVGARLGTPMVSIWSRGQIGFNQGATQEFKVTNFKYVVLYYDPDTMRVGFELTNDKKAEGAVKLVFRKNSGASFSAVPFLKSKKIDYSTTRKYTIHRDEESGLIVLDIEEAVKPEGVNRSALAKLAMGGESHVDEN